MEDRPARELQVAGAPAAGRGGLRAAAWPGAQYLEALFNPVGQQRGGFLYGLLRLFPQRDRSHPIVAGLMGRSVNTNPVLSGYLAGLVAVRLAREARETDPAETEAALERIRSLLAPVLSGLGDRLFWGGVRPALSLVGILSAFLWIGEPALWYWVGYNAVQLYWRRRSWSVGLRGEAAIRSEITGAVLRRWVEGAATAGRFLLGLVLGAVATGLWHGHGAGWCGVFVGICVLGFVIARAGRTGPIGLAWMGIGLAALVALARFGLWKGHH